MIAPGPAGWVAVADLRPHYSSWILTIQIYTFNTDQYNCEAHLVQQNN